MKTVQVNVGGVKIGSDSPIVIQSMCNTHTYDVDKTVEQCRRMVAAGSELLRITVPGLQDIPYLKEIHSKLRSEGIETPLVADIHFSSETAIAAAQIVEKVRINPGNFHKDHAKAREQFARLLDVCKANGTAIRIGLNHGSLGSYITEKYGNTPEAMARAAMEWIQMCHDASFKNVVVSLKSSNTVTMAEAYRILARMEQETFSEVFPFHVGVTEAGNGDSGRIKSSVGTATLISEGIGNTIRVSLTEEPENELPVARYIADYFEKGAENAGSDMSEEVRAMLEASCKWGPKLLRREIDEIPQKENISEYLRNEIMQAARRRFYKPEYIACPGCGRTMYDLQGAFEQVKAKTSHLSNIVIAVMGCIVNGPGEMADADWGYVGEGGGKVTIYRGKEPVLKHISEKDAPSELLRLIEESR